MDFPIDMIWMDRNFNVVGLKSNATPDSYPQTFSPEKPAFYVLETHTGLIDYEKLKIGDKVPVLTLKSDRSSFADKRVTTIV